ncbi:ABC transporter ATP-binding protein [Desulfopila sp. IMCC35006]|uniref:ABC transporter ATP-binding protein n=1 Tax=Desulfopila sp. IMCC35006 TaxID=2569542 RepID=UPI0010ABF94A|nr:ABC transporter ATP-binding protein [Desulfopila sp. IMCC35006]TKB26697.1 ABC transporter ATP-binding protein [Desulfopila sp. IMCC35006]
MQDSQKILEVVHLSNLYDGKPLLQDINFSLMKGEILCLLGPSGSGKTTLLRLLAGLEKVDAGTILFCGRDIRHVPPHQRNFGMMFQEYALFPHKSVQQNIAFGLEMQHCPVAELTSRVEAVLTMVGLTGLAHRNIDELSGGERQRVALARSLAPEPQLLLLDEPLGSLDRALRDRLTGEIRTILKTLNVTAVFVTHDQAEAFSIADKVAILHHGILQQFETPENLYRHPANSTVARFLGFHNLIAGTITSDNMFQSPLGALPVKNTATDTITRSTLLIRPEGARLAQSLPAPQNALQLSGTITDRQFQGSTYRLNLDVNGLALSFDLPIDPPPPEIGRPIQLVLNPSALVLLGS